MPDVLVAGGGAAGMAAALFAARGGCRVHLFEQNEKLGKKLFITGKGRCNFTNACEKEQLFANTVSNPRFLYSAFSGFDNRDAVRLFESLGVKTKTERGGRVFPASDHSSDIIRALENELRRLDVKIHLKSRVRDLLFTEVNGSVPAGVSGGKNPAVRKIRGVLLENGEEIYGDKVILAMGGLSYPATGSTGDGLRLAEKAGHTVTDCRPALVPLVVKEEFIPKLQGLSLKNVRLTIRDNKKVLYSDFGELLFTHFGISGPLGLSAGSVIGKKLEEKPLSGEIDLKPALSAEQLDARLLREFEQAKNKTFKNAVAGLFPAKLRPVVPEVAGMDENKPVHAVTRKERADFIEIIRHFPFTVTGLRGYNEAIITQGGVSVKEVDPSTMESRIVKGLYLAGEMLDLDALTGGFNLQIAWSTAYCAAQGVLGKGRSA